MLKLNNMVKLLKDKKGLSETTEKLLWVLGTVVIAALVIGWAVNFMDADLLPKIGQEILKILDIKP